MRRRRRPPTLTAQERARRAARARRVLVPAAIEATGRRGFRETVARLRKYEDRITSPERLAGWLKGQAKRRGVLSPAHPYVGRRKRGRGPHSPTTWAIENIGIQNLITKSG